MSSDNLPQLPFISSIRLYECWPYGAAPKLFEANSYLKYLSSNNQKSYEEELIRAILICRRYIIYTILPAYHPKLMPPTIATGNPPSCTKILIKEKVSRKWYWRLILFYWHCICNLDVFPHFFGVKIWILQRLLVLQYYSILLAPVLELEL